jgi:hypothetical protein
MIIPVQAIKGLLVLVNVKLGADEYHDVPSSGLSSVGLKNKFTSLGAGELRLF